MHPKCIEYTLSRLFRIGRLTDMNCPNKARTVVRFHKTLHNVSHLIETPVPLNEKATLSDKIIAALKVILRALTITDRQTDSKLRK
jgi:hypothetical protein